MWLNVTEAIFRDFNYSTLSHDTWAHESDDVNHVIEYVQNSLLLSFLWSYFCELFITASSSLLILVVKEINVVHLCPIRVPY